MHIRYATEADAPAVATINIESFQDQNQEQGFLSNVFPDVDRQHVHSLKRTRCLEKLANSQTHVLVAEVSGQVVGCARWKFPGPPEERAMTVLSEMAAAEVARGACLPEGARRDIYDGFFNILREKGKDILRDDDIVLELLATLPAAQGKGVGTALLRWGIDEADRRQKRIYLEATTAGFPLYLKMGWRPLAEAEIDYERWGGKGRQTLVLMLRDTNHSQ